MSDDLTHDKVGLVVSSPYFMMGNVKPIASSVQLSIQGNHGRDSIMVLKITVGQWENAGLAIDRSGFEFSLC